MHVLFVSAGEEFSGSATDPSILPWAPASFSLLKFPSFLREVVWLARIFTGVKMKQIDSSFSDLNIISPAYIYSDPIII